MKKSSPADAPQEPEPEISAVDRMVTEFALQTEIKDIIRQLESGSISPERAQARIMELFHFGMGAGLRAIRETRPDLVATLVKRLTRELQQVTQELPGLDSRAEPSATRPSAAVNIANKKDDVLQREGIVLEALARTDASWAFGEIKKILVDAGIIVNDATLTTNLDRLYKDGIIDRPRKGMYARTGASPEYLARIQREIGNRRQD